MENRTSSDLDNLATHLDQSHEFSKHRPPILADRALPTVLSSCFVLHISTRAVLLWLLVCRRRRGPVVLLSSSICSGRGRELYIRDFIRQSELAVKDGMVDVIGFEKMLRRSSSAFWIGFYIMRWERLEVNGSLLPSEEAWKRERKRDPKHVVDLRQC